jgi:hypothetical protein
MKRISIKNPGGKVNFFESRLKFFHGNQSGKRRNPKYSERLDKFSIPQVRILMHSIIAFIYYHILLEFRQLNLCNERLDELVSEKLNLAGPISLMKKKQNSVL